MSKEKRRSKAALTETVTIEPKLVPKKKVDKKPWWEVVTMGGNPRCAGCGKQFSGELILVQRENIRKISFCRSCGLKAIARRINDIRTGRFKYRDREKAQIKEAAGALGTVIK